MKKWHMLTLVGKDRPGIVAHVTDALYQGGCNLGEASMMRLGGNFSIMLMVQADDSSRAVQAMVAPVAESLGLHFHVDPVQGGRHEHPQPDVRILVYGADRAGIVARVTGALAEAGLNILELESGVAGSEDRPIYIMRIEGRAGEGIEALKSVLEVIEAESGVDVHIEAIDTLIG